MQHANALGKRSLFAQHRRPHSSTTVSASPFDDHNDETVVENTVHKTKASIESDGYDSDDYEDATTAPATPTSTTTTTTTKNKKKNRSTRQAIKTGFNVFLLFGAGIDRFVVRIQSTVVGSIFAMFSLLGRAIAAAGRQLVSLGNGIKHLFTASPAGKKVEGWAHSVDALQRELPDDTWGKLLWLWDRPPVQRIRLTVSMANLSIRLPALLALVATQVGLLASQVSLPMLAPLLLGTGMLLRSIKSNASFLLPRIGLLVVMLWMLWFINSVVHNTVAYLRKQNALDNRLAGGIITVSECSTLLIALVVLLSMLGVNVSALLIPAGVAVAVAAKDLSHNFLAGLFLFVVQPFKLGDRLSVASSAPNVPGGGTGAGWFEGVIEKVDLRYVIVRQGRRRLMVPNSAFITREFMVVDDGPPGEMGPPPPPAGAETLHPQPFMTNDYRHVWQYVDRAPVHQELASPLYEYTPPQQQQPPQPPQQQQVNGPANGHVVGAPPNKEQHQQQQMNTESAANAISQSSAPPSLYPPPFPVNTSTKTIPAPTGHTSQQPYNGMNVMNAAAPPPPMDAGGYWTGSPPPPPPQPPTVYHYMHTNTQGMSNGPWSHPLAPDAYVQYNNHPTSGTGGGGVGANTTNTNNTNK